MCFGRQPPAVGAARRFGPRGPKNPAFTGDWEATANGDRTGDGPSDRETITGSLPPIEHASLKSISHPGCRERGRRGVHVDEANWSSDTGPAPMQSRNPSGFKAYLEERDVAAINRAKVYPVYRDEQRLGYVTPKVDS